MLNETRNVFAQGETRINTSFTISGISTNAPLHKRTFFFTEDVGKMSLNFLLLYSSIARDLSYLPYSCFLYSPISSNHLMHKRNMEIISFPSPILIIQCISSAQIKSTHQLHWSTNHHLDFSRQSCCRHTTINSPLKTVQNLPFHSPHHVPRQPLTLHCNIRRHQLQLPFLRIWRDIQRAEPR